MSDARSEAGRATRVSESSDGPGAALLRVEQLNTVFDLPSGTAAAVIDATFHVDAGETLCLVGESGSGKSVTAFSILRLVQRPGRIAGGQVVFKGRDLLTLEERAMRALRGREIAMIFQEPMTALNPVLRIGAQIEEAIRVHEPRAGENEIHRRALDALERAALPEPERRSQQYPHQLSGGLRQRVMIAMALAAGPGVLIADEPTTALDVTVQKQILELLAKLRRNSAFDAFHHARSGSSAQVAGRSR